MRTSAFVEDGGPTNTRQRLLHRVRFPSEFGVQLGELFVLRCKGCRFLQELFPGLAQLRNLALERLALGRKRFELLLVSLFDSVKAIGEGATEGRRSIVAGRISTAASTHFHRTRRDAPLRVF